MNEDQLFQAQQEMSDTFCQRVYERIPEDLTEAYRRYCDYCEGERIKPVCYEVFVKG